MEPSDRMGGALLGLVVGEQVLGAGEHLGRHATQALILLDSLRTRGRFVQDDVRSQLQGWVRAQPGRPDFSDEDALPRSLALVFWLRGSGGRIVRAAIRQAAATGASPPAQLGSAFLCLWARELYMRRKGDEAWTHARNALEYYASKPALVPHGHELFHDVLSTASPVGEWLDIVHQSVLNAGTFEQGLKLVGEARKDQASLAAAVGSLIGLRDGLHEGIPGQYTVTSKGNPTVAQSFEATIKRANLMYRLNRPATQTSETHPLPIGEIPLTSGMLGISTCPGRNGIVSSDGFVERDLCVDLHRIKAWGATDILCLLPNDQIVDMSLGGYLDEANALGMTLRHVPLPSDLSDRWFEAELAEQMASLTPVIKAGGRILVHGEDTSDFEWLSAVLFNLLRTADDPRSDAAIDEAIQSAFDMVHDIQSKWDVDE